MKHKLEKVCMLIGVVLIAGTLLAAMFQQYRAARVETNTERLLVGIHEQITRNRDEHQIPDGVLWVPDSYESDSLGMKASEVNGYECIGYVTVGQQQIPILSTWSEDTAQIAPGRYSGSVGARNLAIWGQNYPAHFGCLQDLSVGTGVSFTDMGGVTTEYAVAAVDILTGADIQQVLNEPFDMVLFTASKDGRSWIVVYCDLS